MKGKTVLLTGGSRGIGRAIAEKVAKEGARVLAPSRSELDLADDASITRYFETLELPVDVLVNDAGVSEPGLLAEVAEEAFMHTLHVNLVSPVRLAREVAPGMIARGYGRIVNISSMWAVVARDGRVTYAASKAGLVGATRALAVELGPQGILVNAVAPGYVATQMTLANNSSDVLAEIAQRIPLRRLAEPAEVAELVAFLGSEYNSYITGQVIICDGGFTSV
jgi:NAD(P)-dependent dehydrogenase (short-subunit alcohol dehydrogenase family)